MSLSALGEAAGLHKATLFHYFSSKREIARAVFDEAARRLLPHFEALAGQPATSLEPLVTLCEALADEFTASPAEASFLLRAMVAPEGSTFAVDESDASHPVMRMLTLLGGWIDAARSRGALRPASTRYVVIHLLALLLFHPASAANLGGLAGRDPFAPPARRAWKRELVAQVRRGLAP